MYILIFTLAGPLIGTLLLGLASGQFSEPMMYVMGYVIGILPALSSGLAYDFMMSRGEISGNISYFEGSLVSAVTGALCIVLMTWIVVGSFGVLGLMVTIVGLVSEILCSVICYLVKTGCQA